MQAQLEIKLQMARQLKQSGQIDQAEVLISQVLALDPGNTRAGSALAMLYTQQQNYEAAIEVLDQTFKKNPNDSETLIQLATVYKDWGKFDEAKACYRRAIPLNALRVPHILQSIATACKYSEYDDDVRLMEDSYRAAEVNSPARRRLCFALGKVFDDLKSYEKAFEYFQEGNRIVATGSNFSIRAMVQGFQSIKNIMGPEYFERYEGAGIVDDMPIFVTGMARSGTTLVEQILASHPKVHGGGELEKITGLVAGFNHVLGSQFPVGFDQLDLDEVQEKASSYANDLKKISHEKPHVTDKSISNFAYIGLIRVLLPHAKIILCNRDPRDIGLSNFQLDLGHTYPWTYQLDWFGEYYGLFNDLMAHWNQCLPGQIHAIQYEDLITDPERYIRSLLEFCNLEFDPACLAFHATDRLVATASRDQVRKPIYKGSVNRWKNYEQHLGPLISALKMD